MKTKMVLIIEKIVDESDMFYCWTLCGSLKLNEQKTHRQLRIEFNLQF